MKRLFTVLAFTSMINLAALAVGVLLAWHHGLLAPDRLRDAWSVLTGEAEISTSATSQPAVAEATAPRSAAQRIRQNDDAERIARAQFERRAREIQDGWSLLERQQLALLQRQEALEREKKALGEAEKRRAEAADNRGYKKELEILSGLKPKDAKLLLMQKADADVVRILAGLEPRQARKIVGACKKPEERLWIGRVLEKLHERDAAQAEVLGAGK